MNCFGKIPLELKDLNQWVCWGKKDAEKWKCPYNPKTGHGAKAGQSETWVDFNSASEGVFKGDYEGVGFEFTDGYVGVDFDHCLNGEELSLDVKEWVNKLNSYTEISPSGTGLHVICKGKLPGNSVKTDKVEMYDRKRYFTVTGNTYGDAKSVREAQDVINRLYEKAGGGKAEPPKTEASTVNRDVALEDKELLKKAMRAKNGALFKNLWDGNWEGRYQSHSEADIAFLNLLAFYTKDHGQIDRIFRQSGLMRDKWDKKSSGSTYGAQQIEKAINECTGSYQAKKLALIEATKEISEEWKRPIPFDKYQTAPFPEVWGPSSLQDYASASAIATQTPLPMNIAAVLAAAAIPVQGKFKVQITDGYLEPLNIYVAVVARPGERKSAVIRNMTQFMSEYEAQRNELLGPEVMESQQEKNVLMQRQERAQKDAAKNGDMNELKEITDEIANFEEKKYERFVCDDVTPEALISLMYDNGGRMGLMSAEGGIFANMSRYRADGSSDIDVYLKGHAGDTIRIDRKSRSAEYIENPCLTVLLMVQPVVIDGLLENAEYKGRGLPARFLYVMIDDSNSQVGRRMPRAPSISSSTKMTYNESLRKWLDYRPEETQIITLSPEAEGIWDDTFNQIEPRLKDDLYSCIDWASKLPGTVCRIAGILHCYTVDTPAEIPISGDTMRKASKLGFCFMQHALKAYGAMGSDQRIADAKYVLSKIEGMEETTKRDLYRACRRFKKPGELDPALKILREHQYIRGVEKRQVNGGTPSVTIYINPYLKKQYRVPSVPSVPTDVIPVNRLSRLSRLSHTM